jgi:hypothetical protein
MSLSVSTRTTLKDQISYNNTKKPKEVFMKRKKIFLAFILVITGCILLPLGAQTRGDINNDNSIDIIDALLIARCYISLNPDQCKPQVADIDCDGSIDIIDALIVAQYYVNIIPELPDCSSGTYTLTVEVSGKEFGIPRIDTGFIDPPGIAISETAQFVYETGTSVNLYIISATPPPPPQEGDPPLNYQVARFEGYGSNNITISMDSDKTVQFLYSTHTIYPPGGEPYPTRTASPVGDGYLYYASDIYIIEPESDPITKSGSVRVNDTLEGYMGEGYVGCSELPAYLSFGLQSVSTDDYYEIRFRIWDETNQEWTFEGFTEPIRMKFSNSKAGIQLNFSRVNYIIDRIIIFPQGTPEFEWRDLDLMESGYSFTGMDSRIQARFIMQ